MSRQTRLLLVLAAFFLTNAILAELIGGKLFAIGTGLSMLGRDNYLIIMSSGIVLWPVVFVMTDIINEYFGRAGVRRLSILAAVMITYAFVALSAAKLVRAADGSPVSDAAFAEVFTQSQFIIIGSVCAFLLAQLIDVAVFWLIRRRTGNRLLWLRATGSTVVSQLIDSYVVGLIGLYLPFALRQRWPEAFAGTPGVDFATFVEAQTAGYCFKLVVAVAMTPLLYLAHAIIDRYLGDELATTMIEATAAKEGADDSTAERHGA